MTRRLGMAVVALALALASPRPSMAQDPPLVLVHGVRSNGTAWNEAQSRFSRQLAVTVYNPSLTSWRALFPEQAVALQQKLRGHGLPPYCVGKGAEVPTPEPAARRFARDSERSGRRRRGRARLPSTSIADAVGSPRAFVKSPEHKERQRG